MIVLKFGGTSVGTIESLKNVKMIVEGLSRPAIVVVSALGGLTDRLIATAHDAAAGKGNHREAMNHISQRHFDIIEALVRPEHKEKVTAKVTGLLDELGRIYDGVSLIADLPERTLDTIVSFGERMSSVIVAGIIQNATHHNSPDFIKTEKWFKKNIADTELTNRLIIEEFPEDASYPAVLGGFISSDRDSGEITNLGRGGSDYTAALIAAALNADTLDIWTDVDGFMTADPRIIKDARVIPEMTFIESMELCTFGAKVIYPPTIYPVFHKNIPIRILNTFNPSAPGTLITDNASADASAVTGITSLKNTCLFTIKGTLAENVAEINSRTFNTLARKGISVYLVSQQGDKDNFFFAVAASDAPETLRQLQEEFTPEMLNGQISSIEYADHLSTLAVVGEHLRKISGVSAKIENALLKSGVEVLAASAETSKTTATFVIKEECVNDALQAVHSIFF